MHHEPDPVAVRARTRRQVVLLLITVNLLVLASALVASVDLRRLRTPGGTALRWVEAAVFGDCNDYLTFSRPAGDVPDTRSKDELCHDLRVATTQARADQLRIGLKLGPVEQHGDDATAQVLLTRSGAPSTLRIHLARSHGKWLVVRDRQTCESAGCA